MGRSMQNPHLYHVAHFTDKDGKKHMLTVEFDAEGKPGGNSKERYGRITLFNYSAGNSAESTYNVTINGNQITFAQPSDVLNHYALKAELSDDIEKHIQGAFVNKVMSEDSARKLADYLRNELPAKVSAAEKSPDLKKETGAVMQADTTRYAVLHPDETHVPHAALPAELRIAGKSGIA